MHVFANIASAFQPQRIWSAWMWSCSCQPSFSRCGQSVNTLCMLERCAHQQMSWIWLKSLIEHSNVPARGASAITTRADAETSSGRDGARPSPDGKRRTFM